MLAIGYKMWYYVLQMVTNETQNATDLKREVTNVRRVRQLICFSLLLALLGAPLALAVNGEAPETYEYEAHETARPDLTYIIQMMEIAARGDAYFLTEGREVEVLWNQVIASDEWDLEATAFFEYYYVPAREIAVEIATYLVANGITELDGEPLQFRIAASSQNIRTGPERAYERIGSFPHGRIVTALGRDENGWLYVTDGEYTGWCAPIHLAPFDGNRVHTLPIVEATPTIMPERDPDAPSINEIMNPSCEISNPPAPAAPAPGAPLPSDANDNLFWLALTIQHEAGSDWICDEHQLWVGNVVLNRVGHPRFPGTTIFDIVHQRGQYPWAGQSWSRIPISERAFANAQRLLNGERFAPANVVFQAQFPQGTHTYRTFTCDVTGNVHYFGYLPRS